MVMIFCKLFLQGADLQKLCLLLKKKNFIFQWGETKKDKKPHHNTLGKKND